MATARRYGEPIMVRGSDPAVEAAVQPAHFLWRDRIYRVLEILGEWRETGAWWETGAGEYAVFRVLAVASRRHSPGQFDLSRRVEDGQWFLVRAED